LNYGYKSMEYLTGRPHLTKLRKRGKAYEQAAQIHGALSYGNSSGSNDDGGGENDDEKFV